MLEIKTLKYREKPTKHIKISKESSGCNTVNSNRKKLYEYYICDLCGDEIRLDLKKDERTGGTALLPHSLTKCGEIEVALCNKCVKEVLKILEK